MHLKFVNDVSISPFNAIIYLYICSRSVEKYFRGGSRLNWPEGAVSRESIRAVKKLDRLKDMVLQHVGSSRSSLTDLLYGLLKFDPAQRLTARQALNHPFFKNPT